MLYDSGVPHMGYTQFFDSFQCSFVYIIEFPNPIFFKGAIRLVFRNFVTEKPRHHLINNHFIGGLLHGVHRWDFFLLRSAAEKKKKKYSGI